MHACIFSFKLLRNFFFACVTEISGRDVPAPTRVEFLVVPIQHQIILSIVNRVIQIWLLFETCKCAKCHFHLLRCMRSVYAYQMLNMVWIC